MKNKDYLWLILPVVGPLYILVKLFYQYNRKLTSYKVVVLVVIIYLLSFTINFLAFSAYDALNIGELIIVYIVAPYIMVFISLLIFNYLNRASTKAIDLPYNDNDMEPKVGCESILYKKNKISKSKVCECILLFIPFLGGLVTIFNFIIQSVCKKDKVSATIFKTVFLIFICVVVPLLIMSIVFEIDYIASWLAESNLFNWIFLTVVYLSQILLIVFSRLVLRK